MNFQSNCINRRTNITIQKVKKISRQNAVPYHGRQNIYRNDSHGFECRLLSSAKQSTITWCSNSRSGVFEDRLSKPLKVACAQDLLTEGTSQRQELGSGPPQMILEIVCKTRRISDHRETGQWTIGMSHWCCRTTEGTEFWITCKWLAYLSSFSRLQVIQNKCICDSWIHSCGLEPRQGCF